MDIKKCFGGWQHQKECQEQIINNIEEKKDPEVTFESDELMKFAIDCGEEND